MTAEDAIKTVWPCGNPSMCTGRIESCVPKVESNLNRWGSCVSNHGSYIHMAMEMIACERNLKVAHNQAADIVTLDISNGAISLTVG